MEKLFLSFCLLCIMTAGQGQVFSISNVVLDPVSPAKLEPGKLVSISFEYTKPSGDVFIFVKPMFGGNVAANYSFPGSPVYKANTGTGASNFTLTSEGTVDQLRFQVKDLVTSSILYELFLNVNIRFVKYEISNIVFSPASPANLLPGQPVKINFDYTKLPGDMKIIVRPMFEGNLAANYSASDSPAYTANSGSGAADFTLTAMGSVDQVRFEITDTTVTRLFYTTFVTVQYNWISFGITGVSFSPGSPATLTVNQKVMVNFNFSQPTKDVRIYIMPFKSGSPLPGSAVAGSVLYTENFGSGTSNFTSSIPGKADQLRFWFTDSSGAIVLYETFVAVNFTWIIYGIANVTFSPASPAVLAVNQKVNVNFNYSKITGDVRIFLLPRIGGIDAPGYRAAGSSLFTDNSGTGTSYFFLPNAGQVDQVCFQFTDPSGTNVLFETFIYANFSWVNYEISNVTFDPVSPASLTFDQHVSVSFDYNKPDGDVFVYAMPMYQDGIIEGSVFSGSSHILENKGSLTRTFFLNIEGVVDQVRVFFTDTSIGKNLLSEQLYSVDYHFKESSMVNTDEVVNKLSIFPMPCTNQFTLTFPEKDFYEYRIYNLQGILVIRGNARSPSTYVSIRDLPSGTYLVRAFANSQVISKILIKQ